MFPRAVKVPGMGRNTPGDYLPVAGGTQGPNICKKNDFGNIGNTGAWVEAGKSRWGVGVEPIWVARLG